MDSWRARAPSLEPKRVSTSKSTYFDGSKLPLTGNDCNFDLKNQF